MLLPCYEIALCRLVFERDQETSTFHEFPLGVPCFHLALIDAESFAFSSFDSALQILLGDFLGEFQRWQFGQIEDLLDLEFVDAAV